jgi:tetratricopeptide (TPR) repeat protein
MNVVMVVLSLLGWLTIESPYGQAVAAFQRGQYQEVLALLDRLPGRAAPRPAVLNLRAVTLAELHRFDEALAASQEATRLEPGNPNYISNIGLIYLAQNNSREAEKIFRAAIGRFPQSSRLYEGWGESLLAMNHFEDSEAALQKAVDLDPASADAQVGLAKLLYAIGKEEQFGAAASKAIQLNPQSPAACYYYGKYLIEDQQHFAQGAEYVRRSITLSPNFVEGLVEWGVVLSHERRWDEAADAYEKALANEPNNLRVCYLLYRACLKSGRARRAAWALQKYRMLSKPP